MRSPSIRANLICIMTIVVILISTPSSARAQPGYGRQGLTLEAGGEYIGPGKIGDESGEFSISTVNLALTYSYFTLSYQRRTYDWDGRSGIPFGNGTADPWNHLHSFSAGFFYPKAVSYTHLTLPTN